MNTKFYVPEWGNLLPFDSFCAKAKVAGYDGVEMSLPLNRDERDLIIDTLGNYELELIGQYYESFERDFDAHLNNYEKHLRKLIGANPVFINSQTGKDYYSFEQNLKLFAAADRLADESGIEIIHETHRGKSLFAAHVTQEYLTRLPNLMICLDISHWCAVHESLLEDQPEAVNLAIAHTAHIHSRVGYPEGPQINDPRAPEWADTLQSHLHWWDRVYENTQKQHSILTITTEFGPPPYMPVLPYTQVPLANQWEVNVHMMDMLKNRYGV